MFGGINRHHRAEGLLKASFAKLVALFILIILALLDHLHDLAEPPCNLL